jgi:hypothetical protein
MLNNPVYGRARIDLSHTSTYCRKSTDTPARHRRPTMVAAKPVDGVAFLSVRKEVQDFVEAAQVLLSPGLLTSELTPDECGLIKDYVMMMSNVKHPWCKGLPVKYT